MDNSIYITLSRQAAMFRDMDVTANNIANVNTTGYNAEKLLFSQYLVKDNTQKDAYANDPVAWRDNTQGAIKPTGNTFDLAISGTNAYFQVNTPLGVRYTRAGNFQTNADGTIVTSDGYPVLGSDGGEITIPQNAKNIVVNGGGQVSADGQDLGTVGMMSFKDEAALKRMGNSLYTSSESPEPSLSARMVQGGLESSNVAPVTEMVHVMQLSRDTTQTAKFIDTMYDLQSKTASTYTHSQQS